MSGILLRCAWVWACRALRSSRRLVSTSCLARPDSVGAVSVMGSVSLPVVTLPYNVVDHSRQMQAWQVTKKGS
ncbi:hypothetical protein D9M69_327450 [compost metagenome]